MRHSTVFDRMAHMLGVHTLGYFSGGRVIHSHEASVIVSCEFGGAGGGSGANFLRALLVLSAVPRSLLVVPVEH
jgi:hypothetical protein